MTKETQREFVARLDERQKATLEKLDLIYDEVKKTNSRVTTLESWKSQLIGSYRSLAVLSAVISTVIALVIKYVL